MIRSFTENGTPWSGPSLALRRVTARSAVFGAWRARSASRVTYAFSCFSVSMRESTASTTSRGETFFRAMAAARSAADIQQRSLLFLVAAIVCCLAIAAVAFGIFDHVDRSDEPIAVLYEQRLKLVQAAEAAGFKTYPPAPHPAPPPGVAAS